MCKAVLLFFPFFVLFSQIKVGVDCFLEKEKQFSQKKIAFAINHTSCTNQMEFILDVLKTPSFTIAAIFTPEHGLKGADYAWKSVQDGAHKDIPIYSLHGPRRRPTQDMLKGLDAIVYDMQSIGARSYTYETTLFYLMEESAKAGVKVIVLDRPNPMGSIVDGLVLDPDLQSYIGYIKVPYCHGMTIGELATFFNQEYQVGCSLEVIKMEGWKRDMSFSETGLAWIPTSPNIPESDTPFYYSSTGIIGELDFVSIGASFTLPFKVLAAPWINGKLFAEKCNKQKVKGVVFIPFSFRPFFGKFKGKKVEGVLIRILDMKVYRPLEVQYLLLGLLKSLYPKPFLKALKKHKSSCFMKALGSKEAYRILQEDPYPFWKIRALMNQKQKQFLKKRKKYLFPEYGKTSLRSPKIGEKKNKNSEVLKPSQKHPKNR